MLFRSCDDTLKHAFGQVKPNDGQRLEPERTLAYPYFCVIKDELYRVTWDTQTEEIITHLVSPKSCREMLFHAAHSNPMAGHLSQEKTLNRHLRRSTQVMCGLVVKCQLVNPSAIPKAP